MTKTETEIREALLTKAERPTKATRIATGHYGVTRSAYRLSFLLERYGSRKGTWTAMVTDRKTGETIRWDYGRYPTVVKRIAKYVSGLEG